MTGFDDYTEELRKAYEEVGEAPITSAAEPAVSVLDLFDLDVSEIESPASAGSGLGGRTTKFFENPHQHGPLYNTQPPNAGTRFYKKERWEHRLIAYLKAQGLSNKEIAERVNYSLTAVSQILQLPWVVSLIETEVRSNGQAAVQKMLSATVVDNINTYLEIRDNALARPADRIAAADRLMDRFFGKPNQPITTTASVDVKTLTDEELAHLINQGRQN